MQDTWTSNLLLPQSPVPIATLFSPFASAEPRPPTVRTSAVPTCPHCSAASSVFSDGNCQFCSAKISTNTLVSPSPVVDYVLFSNQRIDDQHARRKHVAATVFVVDGTATRAELDTLKDVVFKEMEKGDSVDRESLVGVIVFGAAVSVYELGGGETSADHAPAADVFPGSGSLDDDSFDLMVRHEEGDGEGTRVECNSTTYLAPAYDCTKNIQSVLGSLPGLANPGQTRRKRRLAHRRRCRHPRGGVQNKQESKSMHRSGGRDRRRQGRRKKEREKKGLREEEEEEEEEEKEEEWGESGESESEYDPTAPCEPKRCVLKAVETALALMEIHHCQSGHVVVLTTGGETERKREINIENILQYAEEIGSISIDVMTFTQERARLHTLVGLVNGRPDGIFVHASMSSELDRFRANLHASLQRRGTIKTIKGSIPPLSRKKIKLTIRTSPGLMLTRCIGPITATQRRNKRGEEDGEKRWFVGGSSRSRMRRRSTTESGTAAAKEESAAWVDGARERETSVYLTGGSRSAGSAITMYFELTPPTSSFVLTSTSSSPSYVYVQFVVHNLWNGGDADDNGSYVTRVITRRFRLAQSVSSHLKSMDPRTTAVALVKRALLLSSHGTSKVTSEDGWHFLGVVVVEEKGVVEKEVVGEEEEEEEDANDDTIGQQEEEDMEENQKTREQVERTCEMLDASLQNLARWCCTVDMVDGGVDEQEKIQIVTSSSSSVSSSSSTTKKIATFTHELMEVTRIVYNTRRMLTMSVGRHSDDFVSFRHCLLSSNVSLSEATLSPALYGVRSSELFQHQKETEDDHSSSSSSSASASSSSPTPRSVLQFMRPLPLSTLSMSSDMLLLLHSTREIHIWSGGQVAGVEYDELRSKLMQEVDSTLLLNACPMPKKIISYENSSEARSLYSRLEPSHMDPEFVQLKSFGSLLGELTAEQLKRLRLKMLPTDELTLHGYVAKLFAS